MSKYINIIGIATFFILGLFSLGFCEESMTITTYYPSPYGSYRELRAQFMAIGGNYSGPTYCWSPASCGSGQIDPNTNLIVEGNVGIGTMSPQAKLGIAIASPASPALLWTIAGWNKAIEIPSGAVLKWQVNSAGWRHGIGETTSGLYFVRSQGDTGSAAISYSMFIGDDGNVGIGPTPFPSIYKLWVNGPLAVNSATADKFGGGSWGVLSDARLKDVVGEFKYGLDKIMELKPIRYHYKKDNPAGADSTKEYIGFIAQEVQKVIPEAVRENDRGYLIIESDSILWTMLNAIKELKTKNETLEARIKVLGAKLNIAQ